MVTSLKVGETPRVRTDVVDKVLLEAIAAGLKSNKKVIQTGKAPKSRKAAEHLKVSLILIRHDWHNYRH